MTSLWKRLRDSRRRSERRRDELAEEKLLLEREQQERERHDPRTPIPPMRNNNDWAGWSGPSL